MGTTKHSETCRPSNVELLCNCAAARQFFINLPYEEPGEEAKYGIQTHAIAEAFTANALKVDGFDEKIPTVEEVIKTCDQYDEEMNVLATKFATACINDVSYEERRTGERPFILLEATLDMAYLVPEKKEKMIGTLDFGFISKDVLVIEDMKTGRVAKIAGKRHQDGTVEILPQLACYASAMLHHYGFLYPITTLRFVIHQERINQVSEFECTIDEFEEYENYVLKPAIAEAFGDNPKATPNKLCKYCPGSKTCKARADSNLAIIENHKAVETLSDDEVAALLPKLDDMVKFAEDVKQHAIERMKSGVKFPNYKLVYSKVQRRIRDEKVVADLLKKEGVEPYGESKLLTITELSKKLGKTRFNELVGPYLEVTTGSITIADLDDAREEIKLEHSEEKL